VSRTTRPMKCPMRGRLPGHHTTPAFTRERVHERAGANSCAPALDEKHRAARLSCPGVLHRHIVGALTSRAAFPLTAFGFAIACLHEPATQPTAAASHIGVPAGTFIRGPASRATREAAIVESEPRERARHAASHGRSPGIGIPIATSHGSPYPRRPLSLPPSRNAPTSRRRNTGHCPRAGRGVASRGARARACERCPGRA
jgi:hypothetical protein